MLVGCGTTDSYSLLVVIQNGITTSEDSLSSMKLNTLLQFSPAVVLLGIYPKELKTYIHPRTLHRDSYSFSHNCQNMEAKLRCNSLVGGWINELWYSQIMEYYIVLRKKMGFFNMKNMEKPYVHITEWKKPTEKLYIV